MHSEPVKYIEERHSQVWVFVLKTWLFRHYWVTGVVGVGGFVGVVVVVFVEVVVVEVVFVCVVDVDRQVYVVKLRVVP